MEAKENDYGRVNLQMVVIPKPYLDKLEQRISNIERNICGVQDNQPRQKESEWVSNREACEILGIKISTLYNLRRKGVLPYTSVGRSVRIKRADINKLLESNIISE
ncbi:helix-turn-helix domain-containing protein [Barnesiella intestinihominis]|jgi:excisionase family DNA binding protein|uniref:helix-turn-helix domain-containing protein n=1 Tax=Barnesiella intestinihominis TaxID=487174 RepID=UPI0018A014AD|nr:helix-turn-helix domain-containing protein [Barnesiella intestinihominis]MDB0669263.1 helix-turn-helix domain-containing protein [Barnesiella intestinihominis]